MNLSAPATRTRAAPARRWAFAFVAGVALMAHAPAYAADEGDPAWRAVRQLVGAQGPSGQFDFEYDFVLGGKRPHTEIGFGRMAYITREAAAAYGLSNYFLHEQDPGVDRALTAVLRNLAEQSLPIAKARGQAPLEATGILRLPFGRFKLRDALRWLGLLFRPAGEGRLVSYDRSYETAWGGATALSLLTELQFRHARGNSQITPSARAWLQGLLVLYDAGRGFRELPGSVDEDALSNGEIWLALAYYTRLFADDAATAAIVAHVDDYMMRTYAARTDEGFYLWGMKAAAQRFAATSDAKFVRFIAQQTRAYLDGIGPPGDPTNNSCAAVEGLAAALRVLESGADPDQAFVQRLRQRIDAEMEKNLALQIEPGQTRIDLGDGAYLFSPAVANYAGAFLAGARQPYVRIDYTEHCIAALLELGEGGR